MLVVTHLVVISTSTKLTGGFYYYYYALNVGSTKVTRLFTN